MLYAKFEKYSSVFSNNVSSTDDANMNISKVPCYKDVSASNILFNLTKIDVPNDSFMACICVSGSGKIILTSQTFNAEKGNSFIFLKTGEYFTVAGRFELIIVFI